MYILRLRPFIRPTFLRTARTMSVSPPHKKSRMEESEMIPESDAPVNNLFVPTAEASSSAIPTPTPAPAPGPKQGRKKNRRVKRNLPEAYSPADVTYRDVRDFLGAEYVDEVLAKGDESEWTAPTSLELWSIIELKVGAFTVSGMFLYPLLFHPSFPCTVEQRADIR
jgi:tRNA (uracil-5-)-methyltransferase